MGEWHGRVSSHKNSNFNINTLLKTGKWVQKIGFITSYSATLRGSSPVPVAEVKASQGGGIGRDMLKTVLQEENYAKIYNIMYCEWRREEEGSSSERASPRRERYNFYVPNVRTHFPPVFGFRFGNRRYCNAFTDAGS